MSFTQDYYKEVEKRRMKKRSTKLHSSYLTPNAAVIKYLPSVPDIRI